MMKYVIGAITIISVGVYMYYKKSSILDEVDAPLDYARVK